MLERNCVSMEVPISPSDLNSIVYNVARDLVEDRAVNGVIEEITEDITNKILDDVIFIIERYMYYINSLMDDAKLAQSKKIFETQKDFE
jgi:hypothetical protein